MKRLLEYRLIGITLIIISVFSVPLWLNTYDKGTEIEIVFKAQDKQTNPYQEEYEKMLYPTVRITSSSGTGSGVVIDVTKVTTVIPPCGITIVTGCYILTAAHVVDNQSEVKVELYNSTVITASVIITDTAKDLALLKLSNIQHLISNIYSAHLAPKDYTPYLFTPVWTVGCSLGLKPRPSFGHLCALGDSVADNWEVSSPVLPGNSGGPVFDARTYEVIGIAVWVKVYDGQLITTMAGVVPINQIYEFLNHKDTKDTKN
ncbi:MAG: serine protease [Planctomycetota bacterium]